jgi:hypothetical protein
MKMTFEIPDRVGSRLKATIPKGRRSPFVTALIEKGIGMAEADMDEVCRKANALKLDVSDWEKLNESETW